MEKAPLKLRSKSNTTTHTHTVYLLIGSNLGHREAYLRLAREYVSERIGLITKVSSIYETEPWGVENHPGYLNQVIEVQSDLPPGRLMKTCLDIERKMGRRRTVGINPRPIDLDILLYDDRVVYQKKVTIPHPRLHLRNFTLIPLAEIASEVVHPILNKTIGVLLDSSRDNSTVTKIETKQSI